MPRFAANLSTMFREWAFLDRFDAAADAGFTAVECQFPYEAPAEAVAARLERNGLGMAMFNAPPGDLAAGELGLAAIGTRFADMQASVDRAADYANLTGATRLHLLAGRAPSRDEEATRAYERALRWAAGRLGEHGILLLIEPVNAIDNPGYFLTDFGVAERIIGGLDLPNLRLQFDTYHLRMNGGDVAAHFAQLLPMIGHVQISSPPDRGEPDAADIAFLASLDARGYAGIVGCEYVPRAGTLAGLGWRDRL